MSEIAFIREDECIGCTKCIQACPVDAIIGAAKQMHTVITDECIGCELCVAPCPVDCIDMLIVPTPAKEERKKRADHAKKRIHARKQRLAEIHKHTAQLCKVKISARKAEILAAVKRVIKKHDT